MLIGAEREAPEAEINRRVNQGHKIQEKTSSLNPSN